MKAKFSSILTLLLVFLVQITFAQEQTVTGIVTDQDGLPLPGVNVLIKGTTTGTQTDFDGNYSIGAEQGDILSFSFVGLESSEVTVGTSNEINVTMQADAAQLDEVVVTALGVRATPKSVTYAVEGVTSEEIENTGETNLVNSLPSRPFPLSKEV